MKQTILPNYQYILALVHLSDCWDVTNRGALAPMNNFDIKFFMCIYILLIRKNNTLVAAQDIYLIFYDIMKLNRAVDSGMPSMLLARIL